MNSTTAGLGLTTGGMAVAVVVLGATVDIVTGAHLASQATISGDTEISGLTLAGIIGAAGIAAVAIWKGGRALFRTGMVWGDFTKAVEGAVELAKIVQEIRGDVDTNVEHITDLKEWRATVDPRYFRAHRRPRENDA